jgi:UDP-N-acetylglucosamine acyltransferase
MPVHPTAIVDPGARIAEAAEIGPYCIVGAEVEIGARTRLMANLYIEGPTWIGEDNIFYPYSTVGVASQDLKYKGERAETRIGSRNRIREFVTIHRGTQGGGLVTRIGDDNLLMAYTHVAHDVEIGNHVILGNGVTLAGHVTVQDWADISAFTGVHQFCRIGQHAIIGGYSVVVQDVMPFSSTVSERPIRVFGANKVGLERRGFSKDTIEALQTALRLLTRAQLNTSQAIERIRAEVPACAEIDELIAFIQSSQRGVIKG